MNRPALAVLGCSAFVLGTAEFLVIGLLDLVALDLDVTVGAAGHLVVAYALGIAVGGPLATVLTSRLDRRSALLAAVVAFVTMNIVLLLTGHFGLMLAARFGPGAMHGLFVAAASVAAARLAPPSRQGQAMAFVFGGVAVATVIGVPLGSWVGRAWGWRAGFLGIVVLGLACIPAILLLVPRVAPGSRRGVRVQARAALARPVLAILLVAALVMGGQFSALTYIAPYLKDVSGVTDASIPFFLLGYGIASAVGMFAGGRFADWSANRTLITSNVLLLAILAGLLAFGASAPAMAVLMVAWGFVGFSMVPSVQVLVVGLAGEGGDLAASLGASAINVGIAVGSLLGGWAITASGPMAAVVASAGLCAAALPIAWIALGFTQQRVARAETVQG
jgi:MFS transporter, DHA1 family, inner membrane transport protein